ncbi:Spy/CpxP family protein refolding chaperone [Litorilituus lipolyticus]|uniref:Periplasmic heavy metal sensor n=1 Tax=Litorilituus lipolyticus TaxID=2491017 RepID=A0A502L631_9GAMM|nr:Spy/CpxP family protein refolding chaperone [Litorilituus lipolyticus]TPH17751.1 hypothetical protein EPA86_04165 [Litorilituus lipolyticus]
MKSILKVTMKPMVLIATLLLSQTSYAQGASDNLTFDNDYRAQHMGKFKHGGKDKLFRKMAKVLELTDSQKEQIKTIKLSAKEQNQTLKESLKQMKVEQKALIHADVFDEHAFTALFNAYQPTIAQAALAKAKTKHAIYNVLTAEQKAKWQTFMDKKQQRRKKG